MAERTERFRPDIQGLRAVAVLAVVAFHAHLPLPGGFVGVDVFFVISGFVITGMLMNQWEIHGRLRMLTFSARRFKRLTPALAAMVCATVLLAVMLQSPMGPQQTTAKTALGAMTLVANFVIAATTGDYFDAPAETNPLLNTWSLSVEEQFYLVFPATLFALWWLARRWQRSSVVYVGIAAISVLSLGVALVNSRAPGVLPGPSGLYGFYGPLGRAWEFAVGALVAVTLARASASASTGGSLIWWLSRPRSSVTVSVIGALGVIVSFWLLSPATPGPGIRNLVPVLGTALVILGGAASEGPIFRALASPPMRWLGDRSYSWYLWHWPLIVFAALIWPDVAYAGTLAAAFSLPVAMVAYRWIEQPLRTWQLATRRAWLSLIGWVVLPPIVLAGALLFACSNNYWSERIAMFSGNWTTSHADRLAGCFLSPARAEKGWPDCRWNEDANGRPIYLLGDSNAGHFSEAVIEAGRALGRPVVIRTTAGCPFLVLDAKDLAQAPANARQCSRTISAHLDWLSSQPPGLVITSSSIYPWGPERVQRTTDEDLSPVTEGYLAELQAETIRRVEELGNDILVVQTVPQFVAEPYRLYYQECSLWRAFAQGCQIDMPRSFADAMQASSRAANLRAVEGTRATLLDLRDELCPGDVCSTVHDGKVWYQDSGHLSVEGSRSLADRFTEVIRKAG